MKVFIKSSLLLSALAAGFGCSGGPAANVASNSPAAQSPVAASTPSAGPAAAESGPAVNANAPAASNTGNTAQSVEPASSPAEAYKKAFAIRQKKDVQALKQVMSNEMLAYFTEIGRRQKKSLDQVLALLVEQPQAAAAETRNVRIKGDRALLEFKDASGKWLEMDFVKEDGTWKMALSPVAKPKKAPAPANR